MIKIAICDDEDFIVKSNEVIVKQCLSSINTSYEINTYCRSDNLLSDITDDHAYYDLLLLDIEMPMISGMNLSKQVKVFLPNVKIIFITSHIEYAIDAYELSIFRYVPKSERDKRLPSALLDAVRLITLEEDKSYTISLSHHMEKIPYKDILYIQKDGKYAAITSVNGISKVRKSLYQVNEELNANEFIYIDRGCIVNLIHIMSIHEDQISLKNGDKLFVSRGHLQEVKEQINEYWGNHI